MQNNVFKIECVSGGNLVACCYPDGSKPADPQMAGKNQCQFKAYGGKPLVDCKAPNTRSGEFFCVCVCVCLCVCVCVCVCVCYSPSKHVLVDC